jgi:hypothetical protein
VVDKTGRSGESDLRRRAAWMLAMLALVAVLFVVILSVVLNTSHGKGVHRTAGALDSAANSTPSPAGATSAAAPGSSTGSGPGTPTASITTQPATGDTTCPTPTPCALAGDAGGAVAAVNAARAAAHQAAVSGQTSPAAQQCALTKGNQCTGSWAVTWASTADGSGLVARIPDHEQLLDPKLTGFEVGWAYFPDAKAYYLAIIRNG